MERIPSDFTGVDPGGSCGADDCPLSQKMMASFRKIEPFSLAKLNFFKHFQSNPASNIVNSSQGSKIEHFTIKKQLIASRSRDLGDMVN